jgi:hypothetical protein
MAFLASSRSLYLPSTRMIARSLECQKKSNKERTDFLVIRAGSAVFDKGYGDLLKLRTSSSDRALV